jgi:hypothetical protein
MDIKRVATDAINETIVTYRSAHGLAKISSCQKNKRKCHQTVSSPKNVQKFGRKTIWRATKNKKKLIAVDLVQQITFNQKD